MRGPSASQLDRVRLCPGSAVLPQIEEILAITTAGSVKHRFLQQLIEKGRDAVADLLSEIEDENLRAVCAAIDLEDLPLDGVAAEVAFAWNVKTGEARELGRGLERDYSGATADEITGTADVAALLGEDLVFVGDWKGEWDEGVPPIRRNRQLRWLGMAAARAWGRDGAVIEIIRPGDEKAWRDRAQLDAFDVAAVEEDTREILAEVERSRADGRAPRLVVGDHCKRCPCARRCPALMALAASLGGGDVEALTVRYEEMVDADETRAYHWLQAAKKALEAAEGGLRARVFARGPIKIDEDHIWGPKQIRRVSYVGATAWQVIAERYGAEEAWKRSKISVTGDAVEDLARSKKTKGVTIKKLVEDFEQELAAREGLKVKVADEIRKQKIGGRR